MAYMAKSITYDEIAEKIKTTASGVAETITFVDVDTPIYTVPTGRVAKVMYLQATGTLKLYTAADVLISNDNATIYIKINNTTDDTAGLWLTSINAIDVTSPKCIYLGAGDTLYFKSQVTFQASSTYPAGCIGRVFPSLYMCVIEEY